MGGTEVLVLGRNFTRGGSTAEEQGKKEKKRPGKKRGEEKQRQGQVS